MLVYPTDHKGDKLPAVRRTTLRFGSHRHLWDWLTNLSGLSLQLRRWGETSPPGVPKPEEKQCSHGQGVQIHRGHLGLCTKEHLTGGINKWETHPGFTTWRATLSQQCLIASAKGYTSGRWQEKQTQLSLECLCSVLVVIFKKWFVWFFFLGTLTGVHSLFLKVAEGLLLVQG